MKRSPLSLIRMSKRILELRNEHMELSELYDMGTSLTKLENNISLLVNKSRELYAQRQFSPFMRGIHS